jgi:uncharacterized membrane protein AbrB (regulator of aidB expression)
MAIGQQIMALVLGAISGVLAYYLGLPLPWMLDAMICTTVAAPLRCDETTEKCRFC